VCYAQSLLLHVFWFGGWASKYGARALGLDKAKGKRKAE